MGNKKKILVVLAGCGSKDGSEIHESVLTLLAIDKAGASYECAAPNTNQKHVLNFVNDEEMKEERNMLTESARIARGDIKDLANVSMKDYDALVIPGGFGVAKNLCTFAFDGPSATIHTEADRIINEAYDLKKPIGAICISPALVALSLGKKHPGITLTLGTDAEPLEALSSMGTNPQSCLTTAFVLDEQNKIASTPAYMHGNSSISELERGISLCVQSVVDMAQTKAAA